MKILFILLLIFTMILLLPIPLKIKLIYSNKNFQLWIYNKQLNLDKKEDRANIKKSNKKLKYKDKIHSKKLTINHYRRILSNLRKNKYKIIIKLYTKINYSFEDAAATAITYGFLHQASSLIYAILNHFFYVKDFNTEIKAEYNKSYINLEIKGIVLFNFAKLIYIYYIINKSIKDENILHQCKKLQIKEET
ncbi:DUF2953 domain-containing protein [Clostridium sp. UBA6640]|uniref:DUF2953 domain-containing protein n=1 Tax=Clostridium sp. UBA6640 TaxID=1946370 RepID=UPI0025C54D40|nr:DUF2953 domain-containing protein [Clostridium sp. UBA6640]